MDNKKIRAIGAAVLVALWVVITGFAWLAPPRESSEAERRPLKQAPAITVDTLLNGSFMKDFESYSLDQFPLRDTFRQIKSLFHYYALQQSDNNDIYITDGYAVKQEYPLDKESVDYAISRFNYLYEKYLDGCKVYSVVVPDKGCYLGQQSGHLTMDYEALLSQMKAGMPWATHIDIADALRPEDYYRTDTHWRQEKLLPAAAKIAQAMGITPPKAEDFTVTALERPFYGVYYGQAALPMKAETMYLMESEILSNCAVMDYETGKYGQVYDMAKLEGKDMYEVFLSGSKSLLTIENPAASTGKELIVFRDSFGSSIVPLLVQDYAKVTLVDIRYILPDVAARFVDFQGKDVLFLYSTLVLNNSNTIK